MFLLKNCRAIVAEKSFEKKGKSSSFLHGLMSLAVLFPFFDGLPLVVEFFALSQTQLHLGAAVLEIKADGDQGQALLHRFANQLFDLLAMEQKFSRAQGLVVEGPRVGIGADVAV